MSRAGEGLTGIFESPAKELGRSIGDLGTWDTAGVESDCDDALGCIICFLVRSCKVWESERREWSKPKGSEMGSIPLSTNSVSLEDWYISIYA